MLATLADVGMAGFEPAASAPAEGRHSRRLVQSRTGESNLVNPSGSRVPHPAEACADGAGGGRVTRPEASSPRRGPSGIRTRLRRVPHAGLRAVETNMARARDHGPSAGWVRTRTPFPRTGYQPVMIWLAASYVVAVGMHGLEPHLSCSQGRRGTTSPSSRCRSREEGVVLPVPGRLALRCPSPA